MSEHKQHISSIGEYLAIFVALLGLTALTVWAAFQDMGAYNDLVAMSIAVTKVLLVLLYFMHLKYSSKLTWIFAGAGFFWLFILFGLTLSDYLSRGWIESSMSRFLEG
jgi:cytochrome c oxidase subunit 4